MPQRTGCDRRAGASRHPLAKTHKGPLRCGPFHDVAMSRWNRDETPALNLGRGERAIYGASAMTSATAAVSFFA
ncbi:hypothetical protein PAN31108_03686 [Pandoraea anhela]|uniref:Uncharacterized protein n=1 Tax=Pandoraea anhela TaxID=2508295 RepID=A0A5E4X710_9BURK|nr:hypothetical protein PAN31108_03686 [Pandoraea anhela]